jgi:hypothetical protein
VALFILIPQNPCSLLLTTKLLLPGCRVNGLLTRSSTNHLFSQALFVASALQLNVVHTATAITWRVGVERQDIHSLHPRLSIDEYI